MVTHFLLIQYNLVSYSTVSLSGSGKNTASILQLIDETFSFKLNMQWKDKCIEVPLCDGNCLVKDFLL